MSEGAQRPSLRRRPRDRVRSGKPKAASVCPLDECAGTSAVCVRPDAAIAGLPESRFRYGLNDHFHAMMPLFLSSPSAFPQ